MASDIPSSPRRRTGPNQERSQAPARCWTPAEDQTLLEAVKQFGHRWSYIARTLNGHYHRTRRGKQCRERWHNHVDPDVRRGAWTEEEDRFIIESQARLGNKWAIIAKQLSGRTENSVKNRFASLINQSLREMHLEMTSANSNPSPTTSPAPSCDVPKGTNWLDQCTNGDACSMCIRLLPIVHKQRGAPRVGSSSSMPLKPPLQSGTHTVKTPNPSYRLQHHALGSSSAHHVEPAPDSPSPFVCPTTTKVMAGPFPPKRVQASDLINAQASCSQCAARRGHHSHIPCKSVSLKNQIMTAATPCTQPMFQTQCKPPNPPWEETECLNQSGPSGMVNRVIDWDTRQMTPITDSGDQVVNDHPTPPPISPGVVAAPSLYDCPGAGSQYTPVVYHDPSIGIGGAGCTHSTSFSTGVSIPNNSCLPESVLPVSCSGPNGPSCLAVCGEAAGISGHHGNSHPVVLPPLELQRSTTACHSRHMHPSMPCSTQCRYSEPTSTANGILYQACSTGCICCSAVPRCQTLSQVPAKLSCHAASSVVPLRPPSDTVPPADPVTQTNWRQCLPADVSVRETPGSYHSSCDARSPDIWSTRPSRPEDSDSCTPASTAVEVPILNQGTENSGKHGVDCFLQTSEIDMNSGIDAFTNAFNHGSQAAPVSTNSIAQIPEIRLPCEGCPDAEPLHYDSNSLSPASTSYDSFLYASDTPSSSHC